MEMNMNGLTKKTVRGGRAYYENELGEIVAKTCVKCADLQLLDDYTKKKDGLGGRASTCKKCHMGHYDMNRETINERNRKPGGYGPKINVEYRNGIASKACAKCGDIKSLEEYTKHKLGLGGRSSACKACESKYYESNKERVLNNARNWREENRERATEIVREWRRNNPEKEAIIRQSRRARKSTLPYTLTHEEYNETLDHFGNACAWTGQKVDVELEHFLPLAIGHGGTTFQNCYPCANGLNQSKGDRNPLEWFSANKDRYNLEEWRFNKLVEYLAKVNGMAVSEYKTHVYKCFDNPRSVDDLKADGRSA
jgi:hypothetical protein